MAGEEALRRQRLPARSGQPAHRRRLRPGASIPSSAQSYAEIAFEGRSQHKSQEMGVIELMGPAASILRLVNSRMAAPGTSETSVFDGIDTIRAGPRRAGRPAGRDPCGPSWRPWTPRRQRRRATTMRAPRRRIVPALARGLDGNARGRRAAATALAAPAGAKAEADFLLAFKERDFAEALARRGGHRRGSARRRGNARRRATTVTVTRARVPARPGGR